MDNNNLRSLHKTLQKAGYNPPSYDQFARDMEDDNNLRGVYSTLKKEGYTPPAYDQFKNDMGFGRQAAAPAAPTQPRQVQRSAQQGVRQVQQQPAAVNARQTGTKQPQPQPQQRRQATTKKKKQPYRPSAQQWAATQNMFAQGNAMLQGFKQKVQNMREWRKQNPLRFRGDGLRLGARQPRVLGGNKNVVRGQDRFNPRTGKMEARYITPSGDEFSTEIQASNFQNRVEHAQYRQEHPLEAELEEAYRERERLQREMNRRGSELDATQSQHQFVHPGRVIDNQSTTRLNDDVFNMYRAAMRANDQRIKALERERDQDGFWTTLGKTLFSVDTWDFGAQDLFNASTLMQNGTKKHSGSKGEAQQAMMENTYLAQEADKRWGENDTFMQRAGEITGQAIPFVVEFMATGGFEGVTAAGTKLGSRAAARWATGKVGRWVLKNTGTLAGDMAAGFLMANTTGAMNTAADIINRHQGYVVMDENGDYKFEGGKSWGRSIYEGEMANTLEYYTEKLGVHLDGGGKIVGSWLGKGMERIGAGRVSELLSRITGSEWSKATGQLLRRGGIQDYPVEVIEEQANLLMNALLVGDNNFSLSPIKAMWDGDINKESDEYKKSIFNPKTQADIWGGMLLSIGFMQSPGTIGGVHDTAQYYRFKHKTDVSDRLAGFRLTADKWEPWRERIDNTTNADMMNVVTDVLGDENLSPQEKEAVMGYVGNLMKMRGYNLRTTADAKDQLNAVDEDGNPVLPDPEVTAVNEAFRDGYNMDDDAEMQDARNRMVYLHDQLTEFVSDDMMSQFDNDPMGALSAIRDNEQWNDDEKQAALDYVNARTIFNGMVQRVRDDIDTEIAASDAMIDSRVFRGAANPTADEEAEQAAAPAIIIPATLKERDEEGNDKQVYIVSGNVQMLDDGTMVDTENSDQNIVVVDAESGKVSMISINDILNVDEALDAEQVKEEARNDIVNVMSKQASDRIDGTLPFMPGDNYMMMHPDDSSVHSVQIAEDLGDGTVSVLLDGAQEPTVMSKEDIQGFADNYRIDTLQAEDSVMLGAEDEEQAEDNTPDYALNDVVSLQTDEGTVRGQISNEANEDGLIEVYTEKPIGGKKINLFTREQLNNMLVDRQPAAQPVTQPAPQSNAGLQPGTEQLMPEQQVIQQGINNVGEGLREAMNEQASTIRENDINNWLQRPEVIEALRPYADGAHSVDNMVERALADTTNEDVKAALQDILRFPSSRKIAEGSLFAHRADGATDAANSGELKVVADTFTETPAPVAENEMQPADIEAGTEGPMEAAEPMPMREVGTGKNAETEPDWLAVTPERGHDWLFGESGLDRSDANEIVTNNLEAAQNAVDKASKLKPKKTTNPFTLQAERERIAGEQAAAQNALDYWKTVQSRQTALRNAELEQSRAEQAERDRIAHEQAVADEAARQAEVLAQREEQAQRGAHAVHPAIREKWEAASKVEGFESELPLSDGTTVKGRYMLVESGAVTPSHNAAMDFARSEGFPVDENGNTINDRDYERDRDAQDVTREMGRTFDSRAIQDTPVVSRDGVVLSGNGRTMAGELAARDNTDGAYLDHLTRFGRQYGFTPEQVSSMQHPRLVFVADEDMPYTTETFAKFNAQQMKSQDRTETAVKLGKTVPDNTFGRIVGDINRFDTLSQFYNDPKASVEAINDLRRSGVINPMQYAEMFDGKKVSVIGRQMLENMLLGKAFESNPDALRELAAYPQLRQSVIAALAEISNNKRLGDYSLEDELSEAIHLAYIALGKGMKQGDIVSNIARQLNLFPFDLERGSVVDYTNASILMLADVLNSTEVNKLRNVLALYNDRAGTASNGNLTLDFDADEAGSGFIESKSQIIKDVLNLIENGDRKEKQRTIDEARERRKDAAEAEQGDSGTEQDGNVERSDSGSAGAERSGGSEKETPSLTHDEAISLIAEMEERAELAPDIELTIENWDALFGEEGRVLTPIGEVKMGENQFTKLMRQGREGKLGMIKPTLENPDVIIEDASEAKDGETTERKSSYVFVKAFKKADGSRYYYFTSVTVSKDGKEVVISNQEKRKNAIANLLTKGKLVWKHADDVSAASDVEQGLFSSQGNMSDPTTEGTDAPQTNDVSEVFTRPALEPDTNTDTSGVDSGRSEGVTTPAGNSPRTSEDKGSENSETGKEKTEKVAESKASTAIAEAEQEVNTEPTDAQKEAGNYKKGHIKLDGFDISIEQPKGSTRSGRDASGKEWSVTMQNTYGYIRGTEGVDGDHIDVFLSDNLDEWNGTVYVIDQVKADGSFDEHKVMYGFNSAEEAAAAYNSNYSEGWQGLGTITGVSKEEFKKWIGSSHRKTKPFADYKKVKTDEGQSGVATPTEQTEPAKPGVPKGRIDDFGEKIGGARKDLARGRIRDTKNMSAKDLSTLKKGADDILSQANILRLHRDGQMDEATAKGFMALNNVVKVVGKSATKTMKDIALKKYRDAAVAWEEGREVTFDITDDDIKAYMLAYPNASEEKARESLAYRISDPLTMFLSTYEAINYPAENRKMGQYVIVDYTKMSSPHVSLSRPYWVKNGYGAHRGYPFDSLEGAVAKLKTLCPVVKEKEKKSRGEKSEHGLRVVKEDYGYYIKSRNIPGNIYLSGRFTSEGKAKAYLEENIEHLREREQRLVDALMGSNIGMAEREGVDYRNGKDVTPQDFLDEFGFRGVEFGNWVPQGERQMYLNKTYDAIKDFCAIIGISPKAFSLGGRLGLAFGARGKSRAMAHYEPAKEVINLTRMSGAGSLAHEWFHAVDNYLAKQKTGNMSDMATVTHDVVREELSRVFKEMYDAMRSMDYHRRSRNAGEYWGRTEEEFARLFANYIYNKLASKEATSPVLVRKDVLLDYVDEQTKSRWPYPSAEESTKMEPYFDKLFKTIQEKTDEQGNVVLFQKADGSSLGKEADAAEVELREGLVDLLRETGIEVVTDVAEAQRVLDASRRTGEILREMVKRKSPETAVPGDESPFKATVVSSDDGAKIVQNLETLAKDAEDFDLAGKKNFIGNLAKALEAHHEGSDSQYADFETVNGNIVTIRLADHNATVSNFDYAGREDAISIVISRKSDKGIKDDGKAHVVEFYYSDKKLKAADSDVYAKIVRSIQQALYSGEYKDTTGLAKPHEANGTMLSELRGGDETAYRRTQTQSDNGNIKFFRTKKGEVYGFTLDGKIYIDPRIATRETPVHEYHHLWSEALERANPEAWAKLKSELLGDEDLRELVDEVRRLYPELTDGNDLAHEVFSFYGGRRGAERLRKEQARMEAEAKGVTAKARIAALFDKLRRLLSRYWQMSRDLFAGRNEKLKDLKVDDFADMAMADLLHKVDPRGLTPEPSPKGEGEKVADTFYSNAERAVENVKQEKATAEQWKAMLTKAGGIKAGEDKWMGLSAWLDEHKGESLTKDEVLEFVRDNGIQMEEVNYVDKSNLRPREEIKAYIDRVNEFAKKLRKTDRWWNHNPALSTGFYEKFPELPDMQEKGEVKMIATFSGVEWQLGDNAYDANLVNDTRLGFTTTGLDNKREIAFVVPGVEPFQKNDAVHFGPENEGRAVMWVRFGETTDADGKRVLVIDEIQSNRHQDAREKGYKGHGPEYERLKQQVQNTQDAYFEQIEEYARTADGRLDRTKLDRAKEDDPLSKALWEQWGKDERALRQYNESHGFSEGSAIPAAPFEKNWHEVAMKRMLRLAAEEGFDKVAWTTGEQQTGRYNLGGMVDELYSYQKPDGERVVTIYFTEGLEKKITLDKDGNVLPIGYGENFAGRHISEVVGKSVSDKIMSSKENDLTHPRAIKGEDLRIGGEGMRGFYDQMLPRFMDKYGKKWGVKTGEVTLSTPGREVMHSVDVTDAMRESVLHEGQPLFQKAEDARGRDGVSYRVEGDEKLLFSEVPAVQENIENGLTALYRLANGEDEVSDAMRRDELAELGGTAEIAFIWGGQGHLTPAGRYKGGEGFLKIIEKHGIDDAIKVVETIAKGEIGEPYVVEGGQRVDIDFRDHHTTVSLFRHGKSKSWVLTGYTIDVNTDAKGRGSDLSSATQNDPIRTRAELGAALKSAANLQRIFGLSNENVEDVADEGSTLYRTSGELDRDYPTWLSGQTEEGGSDSDENMYREDGFDERQQQAVADVGTVTPDLGSVEVSIVSIERNEDGELHPFDEGLGATALKKQVKDYARSHGDEILGDVDIESGTVNVSLTSVGEMVDPKSIKNSVDKEKHLAAILRIKEIIANSVDAEVHPDYIEKDENGQRIVGRYNPDVLIHRLYGAINIDGVTYRVKTTIKEDRSNNTNRAYTYEVTNIELLEDHKGQTSSPTPRTTSNSISGAKLLHGVEKSYEKGKYLLDNDVKTANNSSVVRMRAMRERAVELGQKLGVRVRLVESRSELPSSWSEKQKRRRKGWYNKATGEVVIVVPNNNSIADVEATVLHEIVGHKGLRELFGKDFDAFLGNVFNNVDEETRRKIVDRAMRNGWDFRKATEEYLASLAESTDFENEVNRSAWQKIKDFFMELLRKAGIMLSRPLTDADLRYILWRSYQHRVEQGALGVAADVVMRERLGVDGDKLMYRDIDDITDQYGSEEDDINVDNYEAGRTTFEESITNGLLKVAGDTRAALSARVSAMRALGGNLNKLRQAMARQREYDRATVDSIVRLARLVINSGYFKDLSNYEVRRLMSLINSAAGREDITRQADAVVDMLLNHQLNECAAMLKKQLAVKGSKINSKGVEVQGELDITGQRMVAALRSGLRLDEQALTERISETMQRMGSDDEVVAQNAATEYQGLLLADRYMQDIRKSEIEETGLREEMRLEQEKIYDFRREPVTDDAGNTIMRLDGTPRTRELRTLKPEFRGTVSEENKRVREEVQQFIKATEDAIRQNRLERVTCYAEMMVHLGDGLRQSVQRAKDWRDAQQAHVNEIHHNANSDLNGVPVQSQGVLPQGGLFATNVNNDVLRLLFAPMATFEKLLRYFGSKAYNGEGYLFNRFMRGWIDASDREWRKMREAHKALDERVIDVFGKDMKWSDLFELERSKDYPRIEVSYWDGDERVTSELTQGEALYIYMVNKMNDGQMKLRRMGITEEDVEAIRRALDPRFIELGDWLQNTFLKDKRKEYNDVYERMFGAPMAAIENYFPLKIQQRDLADTSDITQRDNGHTTPSTMTGSVIKRTRNAKPLKIHANAFDVVLEHIQDMEHWAAFAEFNRDLNTLRHYKRFKNRVLNMSSVEFGAGQELWKAFDDACAIAAGEYHPSTKRGSGDNLAVNLAKGFTTSCISFRPYTALKQLLSMPAFWNGDASLKELAKFTNPVGAYKAWNWAMENLPGFSKRWESRQVGDVRLMDTDSDYGYWRNRKVRQINRAGMFANASIDALTVAMGANAVFETRKKRYLDFGYSEEQAERRALQDASISYNSSQQSSENAFLSGIQLDRTWWTTTMTIFRSASMGYQRRLLTALRNLKYRARSGYKDESIEFMRKQMVRDGLSEEQALRAAQRIYNQGTWRSLADMAIYGFVLPFFWNLGPYMVYLLMGDDDDDKLVMLEDALRHSLLGPVEGLTGGQIWSELGNNMMNGENVYGREYGNMPMTDFLRSIIHKWGKDNPGIANDIVNLLVQSGLGVNVQTFSDMVVGILDACDGEPETSREATLLFLRVLQVPQSQLDDIYFDELGMSARKAQQLSAEDMAKRYAYYKLHHSNPLFGWSYNEEQEKKIVDKYTKRFTDKINEHLDSKSDEELFGYKTNDEVIANEVLKLINKRVPTFDDEKLKQTFEGENADARKKAGSVIAKRMGGKDTYGSPDTEYGEIYLQKRDYFDLAEDVLLQSEWKKAKDAGDTERASAIDKARRELTTIKKGKHTKSANIPGLGEGDDDKVMEHLRTRRRKMLKEFGITPQQTNR